MSLLLEIKDLSVMAGNRDIVKDFSLSLNTGSITAIVGGSGSGKTTIGLSILKLLPPALKIAGGKIILCNDNDTKADIMTFTEEKMRGLRGQNIGMIFQEPLYAFNPLLTIGFQIEEVIKYHTSLARKNRQERILEVLSITGLPDPKLAARSFPHELSGGMRQRAMIAQAIACEPRFIIADEPTSNLDVTLQARIIQLFRELREKLGLSILLITHDLGMVANVADNVVVIKQGQTVEKGEVSKVMTAPRHDYTKELLEAG